ncbi:MAG: hypothetical protein ACI9JE_001769, partial [Candidatus Krumholzibacteriia bacterium]
MYNYILTQGVQLVKLGVRKGLAIRPAEDKIKSTSQG